MIVKVDLILNFKKYYLLTKPKVVYLIIFSSLVGMILSIKDIPDLYQLKTIFFANLGIYFIASTAALFNCLLEGSVDIKMNRTKWRATAKGEVNSKSVLIFAIFLCLIGSLVLMAFTNQLTLYLTLFAFIGYSFIYTLILKPRTSQNIVIGGAFGALPPVIGWTSLQNQLSLEALILFLIIFLWTPPHFWSLSLYRIEDYRKSGWPMLPITHGINYTKINILIYTIVLLLTCLIAFFFGFGNYIFLITSLILNLIFCLYAICLYKNYSDNLARSTFKFSIWHLLIIFLALLIEHYIFLMF